MLNRVRQPFNVNALAQAAALAALADTELRRRKPRAQPRRACARCEEGCARLDLGYRAVARAISC